MLDQLDAQGFAITPSLLDESECVTLSARFDLSGTDEAGQRNLLEQDWCAELAGRLRQTLIQQDLLPNGYVASQCTGFQKSVERNWLVPLHQDLSITVAERSADPALSGWARKAGVLSVQPPAEVLQRLVAVRLHLDDCSDNDGPLMVVPGSHRHGRLNSQQCTALRSQAGEVRCAVQRGAAMLMRPLLLHASSRATGTSLRRVLHFVFGPRQLPCQLRWQYSI
ncbi:MAG: phytanoyl-CoA dioxygenase family protein [Rhodocyclaceae bacterium]